ncbi:MAG TPA: ABC transporter ATP-binding protein [Cellulomonas sp.]
MDPVISVEDLRKSYGGTPAVDGVSFTVRAGEIFGILGPNGAGKTTTVECVAGLRSADSGTVRVLGADPQTRPEAVREVLGVQLQESALHQQITVAEALREFAAFYPRPADPDELISVLDLGPSRDTQFDKLSGGQKQRLSIALALVGNPKVAILDELTTGLDPTARRATWELIERVRDRGVTILLVTHFMDEAERLCDRLVVIDHGRVVADGTPAALVDAVDARRLVRVRPAAADRARALDVLELLAASDLDVEAVTPAATPGELEVAGSRRVLFAVVRALDAADLVPDDVRTVPHTLEDVFLQVTGRHYDPATVSGTAGARR